jgi:hypothetical protein
MEDATMCRCVLCFCGNHDHIDELMRDVKRAFPGYLHDSRYSEDSFTTHFATPDADIDTIQHFITEDIASHKWDIPVKEVKRW